MAKNQVQFQRGLSLPGFLAHYGSEAQCGDAVFQWRWPEGFVCPECGHTGYCEIAGRSLYQCYRCHRINSISCWCIFSEYNTGSRFLGGMDHINFCPLYSLERKVPHITSINEFFCNDHYFWCSLCCSNCFS